MAMTFSSQGCNQAADELEKSANKIDNILNTELVGVITKVKNAYQSETAEQIYDAFKNMQDKFPEFIQSVTDCSKYLRETVAPAYETVESTAKSKLG